ncbi:MAG: DUF86 domain-containing protein [Roseiflexus sp.]|nr:DUF86 domain-containing protein [Roseiflexus sp.]MCS7291284.1 DUF86 domain-containing protein [Roseiflexus sp.]MDW8145532.1 DUF86 domain-containing protein [Roseiflexaceae bacterium]MDW8231451.1 DUF86 domain-containing protein [Roseiflexaceae bacterium]
MTGALTIARHLAQLRELQQHSRADLNNDWRIRATVDHTLQLAIEVVISVCDQLIASFSLPLPDTGRDAAPALHAPASSPRILALGWPRRSVFATFWCISTCR